MLPRRLPLALRHLGDLDFDPELDFGQDRIEIRIARAQLELNGGRPEVAECGRRECSSEQPDLELVERDPAALDRSLAPFQRVFDALQRDQGVDPPTASGPPAGAVERGAFSSSIARCAWRGSARNCD